LLKMDEWAFHGKIFMPHQGFNVLKKRCGDDGKK